MSSKSISTNMNSQTFILTMKLISIKETNGKTNGIFSNITDVKDEYGKMRKFCNPIVENISSPNFIVPWWSTNKQHQDYYNDMLNVRITDVTKFDISVNNVYDITVTPWLYDYKDRQGLILFLEKAVVNRNTFQDTEERQYKIKAWLKYTSKKPNGDIVGHFGLDKNCGIDIQEFEKNISDKFTGIKLPWEDASLSDNFQNFDYNVKISLPEEYKTKDYIQTQAMYDLDIKLKNYCIKDIRDIRELRGYTIKAQRCEIKPSFIKKPVKHRESTLLKNQMRLEAILTKT